MERRWTMAALDRISQIKTDIDAIVGQKILLKANKGRKKIVKNNSSVGHLFSKNNEI